LFRLQLEGILLFYLFALLSTVYQEMEISFLRNYYIRNATVKTSTHNRIASCRQRVGKLLKGIRSIPQLVSSLLQKAVCQNEEIVSEENLQLFRFILSPANSNAYDKRMHRFILNLVLKVVVPLLLTNPLQFLTKIWIEFGNWWCDFPAGRCLETFYAEPSK
jgi:hypothetical protein